MAGEGQKVSWTTMRSRAPLRPGEPQRGGLASACLGLGLGLALGIGIGIGIGLGLGLG